MRSSSSSKIAGSAYTERCTRSGCTSIASCSLAAMRKLTSCPNGKPMDQGSGAVKRSEIARRIAAELAGCGEKLVASLPDNWISGLISHIDGDERVRPVPVNRAEPADGLVPGPDQ